ncbi:MAG: bifunctional diaminohydroxyphosphoribosylaminopyrimidine deaminase/5-amino-6-(5-phosphoribosylamino)uracil reductase RibD [Myxococcota bacterium]|nr:bifunctional diaminohydroxyphosphoribosylaminopyrimidine deaminase/5-amino-6-(5-phosphoribosylamino)uracil reductase RibD [Myxococcota bacterium]
MTDQQHDQRHTDYMALALRAVHHATHRVSPNPMVGCVIVRDHEIVGQGVTEPPGSRHAEIVALHAAGPLARGADMYVTLEPCCHTGRTPPCTDAMIAAGVGRVFVGAIDPNPVVHGKGIARLNEAGIETHVGILGTQCEKQLDPFRRYILHKRPWVIMKAAATLDGRIATTSGESKWITGPESRADCHRLRAQVDAVLVGGETVRQDDCQLTVRESAGANPRRIVIDGTANIPVDAAVLDKGTIIFHGPNAATSHLDALRQRGAETVCVDEDEHGLVLDNVLAHLAAEGIVRCLVEGGGRVHGSFLRHGLAQEARIYIAPRFLGEGRSMVAGFSSARMIDALSLYDVHTRQLGSDVCVQGRFSPMSATMDN